MRIEHGTYTEAFVIEPGTPYSAAKIYTSDFEGEITFKLVNKDPGQIKHGTTGPAPSGSNDPVNPTTGGTITLEAFKGTIIPLVTVEASYDDNAGKIIGLK